MINTIKTKLNQVWNWIKAKTKRIIFVVLGIGVATVLAAEVPIISQDMKWVSSYETIGFETKSGDLEIGQYAETEGGYYIRTKPQDEAQFDFVDSDYDISGSKQVKVKCEKCAYYHEFQGIKGIVRVKTDSDGYWKLSRIKAYPQPTKTELVPILNAKEAEGAIAHDSSTNSGSKSSVSSFTWSHTCTGSDLTLIVGVSNSDSTTADRPVSSITYNSDALTKIDEIDNSNRAILASLWYRVAPDTGSSYTIEVTLGGTCSYSIGGATSLTGTDANPIGANNTVSTNGKPATITVTTEVDNSWVHDVIVSKVGFGLGVDAGQSEKWKIAFPWNAGYGAGSTEETIDKGDITLSWDWSWGDEEYAIVAAEVKEKSGTPPAAEEAQMEVIIIN